MPECQFPQHHQTSGGGFPWALAVIVAGCVVVGSSAAFAEVVHDLMYVVLGVCGLVTVAALGGLGLVLHHQRAIRRIADPVQRVVVDARMEPWPVLEDGARRAVDAARVVPGEVIGRGRVPRAEIGRNGGR